MNYFAYDNGVGIVPPNTFRISPSQISRFFDSTTEWYREFLLGESFFTGSTASELGTCVHAAANMFTLEGTVHHDQIISYVNSLPPDIDHSHILEQYPLMVDALLSNYLQYNTPQVTEKFLYHPVLPNIGLGGSLDSIRFSGQSTDVTSLYNNRGNTIVDYKTTSSKSPPSKFSRSYYFQQLAYAYLCKQHGINIEFLKLVFITTSETNRYSETTGKRLKDYPSQISEVIHQITEQDMQIIEGVVNLIAHSVQLWKSNPDLRFALAQDWRLYIPPKVKPTLFK